MPRRRHPERPGAEGRERQRRRPSPAFASATTSYSATVANSVSQIKVEPTANDSNATIEYLDDSDATLTDADTSTAVFDFDLSVGSNVVKVKVTAEDGTTTETYQVTITRATTTPGAPASLSASAGNAEATLTWTAPASDGGAAITKYQYRVSVDGGTTWDPDWTDVPDGSDSGSDQGDERTVTVTSLANGSLHTFQVRAVNSEGSGAAVQATATPTATVVAMALAGAEFTLDGKDLDTTDSNCLEDTIGDVIDDCTINIDTTTPIFAVDGTLDSDDRLNIRIGRDKAAVDAASNAADHDDLVGTDQEEELTFLVGRNLMRLWGDEDGSGGSSSEEHFYRVNVVPYWELNGDRLSKSHACRSTADRTAAQITHDNCIVTQFGNTATIQFHNVIKDQFNVYVHVNGTRVINEPGNTDLAGSFDLDLQDGDNVVKVRLASKTGTHFSEDYDNDKFHYKVTPTDVLLNQGATGAPIITGTASVHQTLTAETTDIRDADGLTGASFSYQWIRVDPDGSETDISGAVSSTYKLTDDDGGKRLKVRVSFDDDNSNSESLTSAATAAVSPSPCAVEGALRFNGSLPAIDVVIGDSDGTTVTLPSWSGPVCRALFYLGYGNSDDVDVFRGDGLPSITSVTFRGMEFSVDQGTRELTIRTTSDLPRPWKTDIEFWDTLETYILVPLDNWGSTEDSQYQGQDIFVRFHNLDAPNLNFSRDGRTVRFSGGTDYSSDLYPGRPFNAGGYEIQRCDTSAGCTSDSDWTRVVQTANGQGTDWSLNRTERVPSASSHYRYRARQHITMRHDGSAYDGPWSREVLLRSE